MNTRLHRWADVKEALTNGRASPPSPTIRNTYTSCAVRVLNVRNATPRRNLNFARFLSRRIRKNMTLNYLGYMLADRAVKLHEALSLIKKALQLDPSNSPPYSIGWALLQAWKVRASRREPGQSLTAHGKRSDRARSSRGSLRRRLGRLKLCASLMGSAPGTSGTARVAAETRKTNYVARVQKKLDAAKVKVVKDEGEKQ